MEITERKGPRFANGGCVHCMVHKRDSNPHHQTDSPALPGKQAPQTFNFGMNCWMVCKRVSVRGRSRRGRSSDAKRSKICPGLNFGERVTQSSYRSSTFEHAIQSMLHNHDALT